MAARLVLRKVDESRPAEQRHRRKLVRRHRLRDQFVGFALHCLIGERAVRRVRIGVEVGDQPARHQEVEIEIAHDLGRIIGRGGEESTVHFVKHVRKHGRQPQALKPLDDRLVRREDRMEDRAGRDIDRQLRLKDLVVAVSVTGDLEARGHGKACAVDNGEFGRLEFEPPKDRLKELRPRFVIPRLLGRGSRRRLRPQNLRLLVREIVVGDGARVLRRRQPLGLVDGLGIILLRQIAAARCAGVGRKASFGRTMLRRRGRKSGRRGRRQQTGQGEKDWGPADSVLQAHGTQKLPLRPRASNGNPGRSSTTGRAPQVR